jgi:hypothetical protein
MSSMSSRFDYVIYVDTEQWALGRHQSGELDFFVVTQFHTQLQIILDHGGPPESYRKMSGSEIFRPAARAAPGINPH